MSKPPSIHVIVVPAEGPASDTGASVGALVGGTEVAVGSEVGGKAVGAEVGVGVGVEAGAQAASRIAINKIQIKRFIRFSCSYRELYLLHETSLRGVLPEAISSQPEIASSSFGTSLRSYSTLLATTSC
jgi:hypothetical protein